MKKLLVLSFIFFTAGTWAQSPTDLNTNVGQGASYWGNNVSSTADIQTAFNNARRAEETQLNLTTNSLGNLQLPNNWAALGDDEKVLELLNAERICRSGIDYGSGAVLGLPFEGVETSLDIAAQAHADYLLANNVFTHTGSNSSTASQRIAAAIGGTSCSEFMTYTENIAGFWALGGSNSFVAERAVYNWIYEDASSAWGHRRACLIQNSDSYGGNGFTNDYGSNSHEGMIGIGFASAASWDPFSFGNVTDGDIVVLNLFDPLVSGACNYSLFVGVENIITTLPVTVYPNPVRSQLNLDGLENGAVIRLVNGMGQSIINIVADSESTVLNVETLPVGIYFLNIRKDDKEFATKIVVR